jgi:hypothetical protein
VNTRRFFAYCLLAAWIGLTPVAVKTALDWIGAENTIQLSSQQSKLADGLDDRMVVAFRTEQIKQIEFWWEGGIWAGLTLIGSALLAEPRHKPIHDHSAAPERSVAQAVEV